MQSHLDSNTYFTEGEKTILIVGCYGITSTCGISVLNCQSVDAFLPCSLKALPDDSESNVIFYYVYKYVALSLNNPGMNCMMSCVLNCTDYAETFIYLLKTVFPPMCNFRIQMRW